ncbi:MAG: hypothetical protein HQ478_02265 [Chloroflexi bacterium]|nr:hypothetical protein [Chloroflexota bacterium]
MTSPRAIYNVGDNAGIGSQDPESDGFVHVLDHALPGAFPMYMRRADGIPVNIGVGCHQCEVARIDWAQVDAQTQLIA